MSLSVQPGGFPVAPWTPSESHPWEVVLAGTTKIVPSINRLIPLHPKGARRFPKGDRKALWSPVRAKPYLAQRHSLKGKSHIQTIPQARQGLGKWVKGQWPLRGCRGQGPRPGSRGRAPGGFPKGKALWWGAGQSPASRSPEGAALWRGPGAAPLLTPPACGASARTGCQRVACRCRPAGAAPDESRFGR